MHIRVLVTISSERIDDDVDKMLVKPVIKDMTVQGVAVDLAAVLGVLVCTF